MFILPNNRTLLIMIIGLSILGKHTSKGNGGLGQIYT